MQTAFTMIICALGCAAVVLPLVMILRAPQESDKSDKSDKELERDINAWRCRK